MKKQTKRALIALCVAAAIAAAAGLAACNDDGKITLKEFSVIDEVTVELGSEYYIPDVLAVDSEGKEYPAAYTVKQGDSVVEVSRGRLPVTSIDGYVITYTATVAGEEHSVTTTVKVTDTIAPTVYFRETSVRVPVGEEADLPEYVVQDYSPIAETRITAHYKNGETGISVNAETNKFTPEEIGFYRIEIEAEDALGNTGGNSAILFAYGEKDPEVLTDVVEDFSSGYDPSLIYSPDGQVTLLPHVEGESVSIQANTNGNYWPNIRFSAEFFETYTAIYDKVLLTVYNAGAHAHQIYYQTAGELDENGGYTKNAAYSRFTIPAGGRGEIEFTAESIQWSLERGNDITLVTMNDPADGNNEMLSLYFEKVSGRFADTAVAYTGDEIAVAPIYQNVEKLAGKTYTGFEVYCDGVKTENGVDADSFTPQKAGAYQVRVLFGADGFAAFDFDVRGRQMSLNENFEGDTDLSVYAGMDGAAIKRGDSSFAPEGKNALIGSYTTSNGWPGLAIDIDYLAQFVDYYDYFTFKIYNGGQFEHQFYIETPTRGALRRYVIGAGQTAELVIYSHELQTYVEAAYDLHIVLFNDNSASGKAEDGFFLFDDFRGAYTDVNVPANKAFDLAYVFGGLLEEDYALKIFGADGAEVTGAAQGGAITLPAGEYTAQLTVNKAFYAEGVFTAKLVVREDYTPFYGFEEETAGSAYGGGLFGGDCRKTSVLVSTDAAGTSEGTQSLTFNFDGVNDGYPYFVVARSVVRDFYYFCGEMHFDVYNAGAKQHDSYIEAGSGYVRQSLAPASRTTVSLTAEQLAAILSSGGDMMFQILNVSGTPAYENAAFRYYIDNVRGAL